MKSSASVWRAWKRICKSWLPWPVTTRPSVWLLLIRYGSAERFLQLAIEATLDIGAHLVADLKLGAIEVSRDVPYHLGDAGIVPPDLRETWIRMIGFRNILVHDYLELDRHIVYQVLQNHLDDFRRLAQIFARSL